jgi:MFS family permease
MNRHQSRSTDVSPADHAKNSEPPYPPPRYAWYVVGVLVLAYISSILDRAILGLLVEPIRKTMGVSDLQVSLLVGVSFTVFYTFLGLPFGRLVDAASRRAVAMAGVATWSVATALCGVTKSYGQLFAARIGVGVGEATLGPAAYSLIADYFPPERRSTAMGVYSMGISIGTGAAVVVGGLVAGYAAQKSAIQFPFFGSVAAWQMTFFYVGLPGLLIAALMLTIREPQRRGAAADGSVGVSFADFFAYVAANWRTFLAHSVGLGMFTIYNQGVGFWVPTLFIRTYGWTQKEIGLTQGVVVTVFGTLSLLVGGRLADYFKARGYADATLRMMLFCAVGLAFCGPWLPLMPDPKYALAFYAPAVFFAYAPYGIAAAGVQEITPNRMRGQASALFLFTLNIIGGGAGPVLVGYLTDKAFGDASMLRYSMTIVGFFSVGSAIALYATGFKHYRQTVKNLA